MTASKAYHILTLVIQQEADIPRVRSKVKLLVRSIGAPDLLVTGLAVGASETARLLLQQYGGGQVRISLLPLDAEQIECTLELLFHGVSDCKLDKKCPLDAQALLDQAPFPGLLKVFDSLKVQGGIQGGEITVRCQSGKLGVAWKDIHGHLNSIRSDLFADTEESYVENLRAKHDEVVRLLSEKTEQNKLLDQSNNELLQLSNDLEELARERTIIEMSLRIADQVRNPTTVIGGLARRMVSKGGLSEQNQMKISLIAAESDKIEEIVKQFNAMAAERRTIFEREDLVSLTEEALQSCPTMKRKGIRGRLDSLADSVEIYANSQILKVALIRVLRYLCWQSSAGEEIIVVIDSSNEPQMTFSVQADPAGVNNEDGRNNRDNSARPAALELVRQILTEHQATLKKENDADNRITISIHFPRLFHEQALIEKQE